MSIFDKLISGAETNPILSYNHIPEILPNIHLSLAKANYASEFYKRLCEYVIDFEESLQDDEEVAIKLVSFGETIIVHVDDIGYNNPSLISFTGSLSTGERVNLIQHVTQLSFLLIATKPIKSEKRKRIGYKLKHELEEEKGTSD